MDPNALETTRRGLLVRTGTTAATAVAAGTLGFGPAIAAAAPAPQARGNVFRRVVAGEPDTIDPNKCSFADEIGVAMRVFRNLLQFDMDANLVPDQAVAMPEIAEGGLVYTFTLRDDITYSDGKPVTAADFEYGWKRQLDPATASEYAFTGYAVAGAEAYNTANPRTTSAEQLRALRDAVGVKALDAKTLQFRLRSPSPWFLSVLSTWVGAPTRQDIISQHGDRWTEAATYIGNGPFILTEWEHQVKMALEANPTYYAGKPALDRVEQIQISEPAIRFASYLNDELDEVEFTSQQKPQVDADRALTAQFKQYPSKYSYYIYFNTTKAPFDNQKVRAAFSFAIDRISYVRNMLGGQGIPARQFVTPGQPGHFEYELEEQTYNPTVAQRLMTEAGFPGNKGLPRIKFGYSANAVNNTRYAGLMEIIKKSLGADVPIELDPMESRAYTAAVKQIDTTPQMGVLGWGHDYVDPQNWYSTVFHGKASNNHTGWNNADFNRLCDEADVEQDPVRRTELYRQAAQILMNDAPAAFFYYGVWWGLVKPRVQNWRGSNFENFRGEHNLHEFRVG
jgi:oligopeptide transport system substrate-binding protein